MALIPPVIATLIADTKEYMAKMDEAQAKMAEFGGESSKASALFSSSTASIVAGAAGVGVAIGAYAVDAAMKFNDQMDSLRNQAGLTEAQTKKLSNAILDTSAQYGVATSDLASSALTLSQAGIKTTQAIKDMNDAAKASISTNTTAADATKALVAAQTLQISKGMTLDTLTGKLVAGSHEFVGGLNAEEQMLSGRVGVALAKYGIQLSQTIALGSEFAKIGLPGRAISSFVATLGTLEKPLTDSKGKLTTYADTLQKAGFSLNKLVSDARTGNVVDILTQIKDVAAATHQPVSQLATDLAGTGSGSSAWAQLLKQYPDLIAKVSSVSSAGVQSLNKATQTAMTQPDRLIKIFEQSLNKAMVNLGTVALPWVITGVKFATGVLDTLTGLISGNYHGRTATTGGRGQAVKDVLGGIWNAFDQEATSFAKATVASLTFNQTALNNALWNKTSMPFMYHASKNAGTSKTLTVNNTHHFK